jgi:VWFA-related protein
MARFGFRFVNLAGSAVCGLAFVVGSWGLARDGKAQAAPTTPPSSAQTPAAVPAIPVLTATTREVLLDVVVTDGNGTPVTGLTAADFPVSEDGEAQRLTHVEEHHPMTVADLAALKSAPALPPNTFSNFQPVENTNASTVILLDALDTPIQAQMQLREQLIDYMKHVPAGTPIAIFQVDTEMRLIQGFSADPEVLLAAAKSKRDQVSLNKPWQGNRQEFLRFRRDILRDGFRLMGRYLAGFPGRKNLIWFTAQVPENYRTQPLESSFGKSFRDDFSVLDDNPDNPLDLTDALTLSRVAVYPIDARGLEAPAQYDASRGGSPGRGANQHFETLRAFQHLDLDQIAQQTGGKAYYNTNGLKDVIAAIVANGSSYYTLAYSTTNQKWEGQFRHIRLKLSRPGLSVQYRQGYYAIDRTRQEQRLVAAMQRKKAAASNNPFAGDEPESDDAPAADESAAPAAGQNGTPGTPAGGALIQHPKGGFEASMQLGAIPPTEVILTASLSMGNKVEKLEKDAPQPAGNFLVAEYKTKPFRTYTVQIHADVHGMRLNKTADGVHHGKAEFVTVVFDQEGRQVNSLASSAEMNFKDATYRKVLVSGIPVQQQIAVPLKGNFFLRIGVHDLGSDHIGAMEIPVDAVHAGATSAKLGKP